MWCHVPVENLTVWFDPNFPSSRRIDFLGWLSWDTQPKCMNSFSKATDSFHHFSSTFYWAAHQPQHGWRIDICRHICITMQTWTWDTREGAKNYMKDMYTFSQGNFGTESFLLFQKGSLLCCLNSLRVSARQSVPSLLVQEKTILLFVSDHICFQTLDHDGNNMSLLLKIVHLLSTDSMSHLPIHAGFFPFKLLVTAPLSTISFQALKFRVLIVWSISVFRCFEYSLVHTKPTQSQAEQNPAIFDLCNTRGPSPWVFHLLPVELGPILHRNPERHNSG